MSVCPVCKREGMNQVWQQGANAFICVCESCDSLSMMTIGFPPVPIESLFEDFTVTSVHLAFGVAEWLKRFAKNLWKSLTKRKPSINL